MTHDQPRTLAGILARNALAVPHRVAIVDDHERVTFGELHARAVRAANSLLTQSVSRGDRVAYLARDTAAFFDLLYACSMIGAVAVPLNTKLAPLELEEILRDSDARILFVDKAVSAPTSAWPETVIDLGTEYERWRDTPSSMPIRSSNDTETPLAQMYTSGTTGRPKGVVLAERTFTAIADQLKSDELDWIDWRADDISLNALPVFHIGGLWWATQGLNAAASNVFLPTFTGSGALAAIRRHSVTTTCLVPAMMLMLLSEPDAHPSDFETVRKIVYGGSPIGHRLLARAIETFDCELVQIYGLTETGNTALCLPPEEHHVDMIRIAAAGRPYPGVDIQILDENGVPVEQGQIGEVYLRSPAQMIEYWNRPEETAATLVSGWVRTGDAGHLDSDGYLFICDRVKDMIIVAGENVYPAEVENHLTSHPSVHDAAVIGIPDERWGETILAFVVAEPTTTITTRDLAKHLTGNLASYKLPTRYQFVQQIPRNPSGKILRRILRDEFWSDRVRQVN